MDRAIVAQRHQLAIVAVADVVSVSEFQRQFAYGKARHQHLERRRIGEGFQRVTGRPGGEGIQRRSAGEKLAFHGAEFRIVQRAVIDADRCQASMEKSVGEGRLRRIIGAEARA